MTDTFKMTHVVEEADARRFLERPRIAVVGASEEKGNFGAVIARELAARGTDVVAVHPSGAPVGEIPGYVTVGDIPGDVDGAILVVPATASGDIVRQCADKGIPGVWFFQGIGGRGAVAEDALAEARRSRMEVVAGACPMMFLEPVGWFHRVHRGARRHRGALMS